MNRLRVARLLALFLLPFFLAGCGFRISRTFVPKNEDQRFENWRTFGIADASHDHKYSVSIYLWRKEERYDAKHRYMFMDCIESAYEARIDSVHIVGLDGSTVLELPFPAPRITSEDCSASVTYEANVEIPKRIRELEVCITATFRRRDDDRTETRDFVLRLKKRVTLDPIFFLD